MKSEIITCINCQTTHTIKNKHSCFGLYCSQTCQHEFQYKEKIRKWLNNEYVPSQRVLKRYITETRGNLCSMCGISEWNGKTIIFDLEHKDGDSENNNVDNLELLCPNCHSQTDTYKGANKGKGRHVRRLRYAEGKSY